MKNRIFPACAMLAVVFLSPASQAQIIEIEPNQTCATAQLVGQLPALPAMLIGSLDTPPIVPDVDFFRFGAAPGQWLRADLFGASFGGGTLGDPYLGLFDGDCNLLAISDDFQGLDSRLEFQVPASGSFVLAAQSCCDPNFLGNGNSSGSYTLQITQPPPPIGSISVQLANAATGAPLPGTAPPFAYANLFRCNGGFCDTVVAGNSADEDGRVLFTQDFGGSPLEAGAYQVQAYADRFQSAASAVQFVGEGENADFGQLLLQPPPISLGAVRACNNVPAQGGICLYSLSVTNNTAEPISLRGWSLVNSGGIGSPLNFSVFPANRVRRIADNIPALGSSVMTFNFVVPPAVADGAYFCTDVWISDNPNTYVDTIEAAFLFCVSKVGGRYVIESDKAAAARRGAISQ